MALRLAFERAGYAIQCVRSATGVRAALEREQPLAVLVSLDLPAVDAIIAELSLGDALIPVVAMSSTALVGPLPPPMQELLMKPVDARSVVATVERLLVPNGEHRVRSTRILLVDDDDIQRKLVGLQLTDAGFRVHSVRDGHEALTYARREKPDLVLTDILMPGIDGFSLCAAIRADETIADIPVVLATATFVSGSDRDLAAEVGASSWVVRDPRGQTVVEAVEKALADRGRRRASLDPRSERLVERRRTRQTELVLERGRLLAHLETTKAALAMLDAVLESVVRGGEVEAQLEEILVASLGALGSAHGAIWLGADFREPAVRVGWPEADEADAWTEAAESAASSANATGLHLPLGGEPAFFAIAPIQGRGSVLGALVLAKPSDSFDDKEWIGFTRSLGLQLGQALELRSTVLRAEEAEHRALERARMSELVAHVSFVLAAETSIDVALQACSVAMENAYDGLVQTWTLNVDGKQLDVIGGANRFAGTLNESLSVDHPIVGAVMAMSSVVTSDIEHDERFRDKEFFRSRGLVSANVLPLVVEGRVVGLLGASSRHVLADEEQKALGSIADAIAVGIGRKRSELESVSLRDQLVRAQRLEAVAHLAGGIAHDFNNMLAVVMACAEILGAEVEKDESKMELVEEIRQAAIRSASLTRQLLAFSRKQTMRPASVPINDIVSDVSRMLGRVIGEHVQLSVDLASGAGSAYVDRGQIEQVLVNLVVNARDAMPSGGHLSVSTRREGAFVLVAVRDTGCGMDAATMERIFDPFFTTKEEGKGTGLGLAMVHGIATQLGGSVRVESVVGKGSTFTLVLPASASRDAAHPSSESHLRVGGHESVLVVEDDVAVRRLVQRTLERVGYRVIVAKDVTHAIDLAAKEPIDLLLTDVVMPTRSGPDLAADLRQRDPGLRVLLMSGHCDEIVALITDGAPVLQKPFEPSGLCESVRAALDRRAA